MSVRGYAILDQDIREALKRTLREQDNTAAIIDELPLLRGRGRADIAFVNGELSGYEIKSEADSLVRLWIQIDNYESIFEFNTIVAAKKHLKLARQRLPHTWGIIEARQVDGKTELRPRRKPQRNHKLCSSALARLLWKNECLTILRKMGADVSQQTPVARLWTLLETMSTQQLCDEVRKALKHRQVRAALQRGYSMNESAEKNPSASDSKPANKGRTVSSGLLRYIDMGRQKPEPMLKAEKEAGQLPDERFIVKPDADWNV